MHYCENVCIVYHSENFFITSLIHSDVFLNLLTINISFVLCIVKLTGFQVSVFLNLNLCCCLFYLFVCCYMGFQT